MDFESFGLNQLYARLGGNRINMNPIANVPLSVRTKDGEEIGFVIPVNHTEIAGVPNFTLDSIKSFLKTLSDEFFLIFHNSLFDREIMQQNGIELSGNYADTMLLAIACQLRVNPKTSRIGLKDLSEDYLDRTMLEIKEIMGENKHVAMTKLPASSTLTYAAADAINTLALFELFTDSEEFENPYETQRKAIEIDLRSADATRAMNRFNLPIHYTNANAMVHTLMRRLVLLENNFDRIVRGTVSISSPEQVGTFIGSTIVKEFERQILSNLEPAKRQDKLEALYKRMSKEFKFEIKVKQNKAGERTVFNSSDDVLTAVLENLESWDWLGDDFIKSVEAICITVSSYRTLQHDINIIANMVRNCYCDDNAIIRAGVGLRYMGTITTRYANESGGKGSRGAFDHIRVSEGAKGYKGK